jgi:hypothetical protein
MSVVPVATSRVVVDDDGSAVRVTIPARRRAAWFLVAMLPMWAIGETLAIRELLHPTATGLSAGFLVPWLAGWSLGGLFGVGALAWMAVGREIVELRSDALVHARTLLGLRREWVYELATVKNLRTGPWPQARLQALRRFNDVAATPEFWGLVGGPIVFDYGAKTVRCGAALEEEAEGAQIVERFKHRNARLRGS